MQKGKKKNIVSSSAINILNWLFSFYHRRIVYKKEEKYISVIRLIRIMNATVTIQVSFHKSFTTYNNRSNKFQFLDYL